LCTTVPTTAMSHTSIVRTVEKTEEEHKWTKRCLNYDNFEMEYTNLKEEKTFFARWSDHLAIGLEEHMHSQDAMKLCLEHIHSFLLVITHSLDPRNLIQEMTGNLTLILQALAYYTEHADIEMRHTICRKIVRILKKMSGRIYINEFRPGPEPIAVTKSRTMTRWIGPNQILRNFKHTWTCGN